MNTLAHHGCGFHQEGAEHTAGKEAATVVHHNRCFADLLNIVEAFGQGFIVGFCTHDDFNQRHFVHGAEEVQTNELVGALGRFGQASDWQSRGIGRIHGCCWNNRFCFGGYIGFHGAIFEHSFNHQIRTFQFGIVGGGGDQVQQCFFLFWGAALFGNGFVQQVGAVGLAFVGTFLGGVDQHDFNAHFRRHIRDAGTHHARTQHANFLDLAFCRCAWAALAFLDAVELIPQRVHHVLAFLRQHAGSEITAFHFQTSVDVGDTAFEYAARNVSQRWVIAKRLGVGHAGCDRPNLRNGGVLGIATGEFETFHVPWLQCLGIGDGPGFGLGNHVFNRVCGVLNDAFLHGLLNPQLGALGHHFQRTLNADHAGQTLCTTATGQQTQLHFGQTEFGFGVVQCDAVVTSHGQFQTATQGCAVQGAHNWLLALFHAT